MQRLLASIHPDDVNGVRELLDRSVRQKEGFEFEYRIVMPDTLIKYLHIVARTVTDAGELHYIVALMDVTSFREAQEHLRKAQADLAHVGRLTTMGELAASIAHEVTQPLMAVVTNAESCLLWLGKEEPNLDKARNAAQRIIKNGHRAGDVVKSIRSLARKALPDRIALDINGVIRETVDLMQEELRRKDVSCETLLTEPIELIEGDRTQLQQVILNLVMNGVEAMSTTTGSPRVLRIITGSDHDGGVATSIEDSGSGIDAGVIDRIFEPLFTTKPDGMGLGLSICRSIVEAHGGRLWVLPNPIGGSIFRFSIPEAKKRGRGNGIVG
jgi:C4-dicarboxylate-specific signal transduction histidine kinase